MAVAMKPLALISTLFTPLAPRRVRVSARCFKVVMKRLNLGAIIFLLLLLPIASLPACGSSGGSSSSSDQAGDDGEDSGDDTTDDTDDDSGGDTVPTVTHLVPDWLIGTWLVIRLRLGADVSRLNMILTVTDTGFEYHYPGCDVYGTLLMDDSIPFFASNDYELSMTSVDCASNWDIPSFAGSTDQGNIWADNEGERFFRLSDLYSQFTWVYSRQ
jgi:hypothetical protein